MTIILETNIVLTKGVPLIILTASAGQLPGLFGGKIDLNALSDVADEIQVTLKTKYTSGGSFVAAEPAVPAALQSDQIFRLTPVEEVYGYEITVELLAASVSATATLPVIITRSPVT